jgi:BirA family biotin operon repressor/biotin-[acetyl-CoA-carboxylase] ligase
MLKLLTLLADGCFHSGNDLGYEIGVSRAAVWKRLQRLTDEFGLEVQSVPGKGYRLAYPLSLLKSDILRTSFPSLPIFIYDSIGSTNDEAKKLLAISAAPFAVLAEHQLVGRGRRGREWCSPYAQNLYLSFVWPISQGMAQVDGLSLVVGLAVVRAVEKVIGTAAQLKWPNDVLINNQKVAGILLELVGDPADLCHVVIGIGVNLNMTGANQVIDQQWTSLYKETGQQIDRTAFAQNLLDELDRYLDKQKTYGFPSLKNEWLSAHAWQGRNVILSAGHEKVWGKIIGVGNKGEICLLVDGSERLFVGGELSLRLQDDT